MKKTLIVIALLCVLAATAVSGYIYQTARPLRLEKSLALPFQLSDEERSILYYASLAPNAHNAQPWQLRHHRRDSATTQTFTLTFDERRSLPHTDPVNREAYLSLGAFLEDFRQASLAFGFRPEIEVLSQPANKDEIARIRLTRQESASPASAANRITPLALIERRHTDKRPYGDAPIAPQIIARLLEQHQPYLSYYAKGTPEFAILAENSLKFMQTHAKEPQKRNELALWLRFSNEEAQATRDGLPAEGLGISGIQKFLYYFLYNREKTRGEAFAQDATKKAANQINHSAGFFVISGNNSPPDHIRTGMSLEAFWLDAVASGISMQPVSQALGEEGYRKHLMETLNLPQLPQLVLRAGILADYGENQKIRRNIGDFVSSAE